MCTPTLPEIDCKHTNPGKYNVHTTPTLPEIDHKHTNPGKYNVHTHAPRNRPQKHKPGQIQYAHPRYPK